MNENAKQLGIDPSRIAVKGESAGGGHSAMLALEVRDRKKFTFCQQVLIYPMLDDRTGSTRDVPPYIGHYIWTPRSNRFGWTSLLGIPAGSKAVRPNSVPARVRIGGTAPRLSALDRSICSSTEDVEYSRRLARGRSSNGAYGGSGWIPWVRYLLYRCATFRAIQECVDRGLATRIRERSYFIATKLDLRCAGIIRCR